MADYMQLRGSRQHQNSVQTSIENAGPPRLQKPTSIRCRLTNEDAETVLRIMNASAERWGAITQKQFWADVTAAYTRETGRTHSNLKRNLSEREKAWRQAHLPKEDTEHSGEVDPNDSEYNIQMRAWVAVVDEEAAQTAARKARAGEAEKESEQSARDRQSLLSAWTDKQKLSAPYRQREKAPAKRARTVSNFASDSEESKAEDEDESARESTSESSVRTPRVQTSSTASPELSRSSSVSSRRRQSSYKRAASRQLYPSDEGSKRPKDLFETSVEMLVISMLNRQKSREEREDQQRGLEARMEALEAGQRAILAAVTGCSTYSQQRSAAIEEEGEVSLVNKTNS
jgi:hypothetical protein